MVSRRIFVLIALASPAAAQDTAATRLPAMVTVTRQAARSPFDLPFGITTISPDSSRPGQAHLSADQTLFMIPGLTVANRTNPSQDVRVSVRGFGARSAFGVRSVRILRDGMPLTLPDGQTPLDYLDLESVGRIEVIRGTASALYGNASGGVIDIRSAVPPRMFTPEGRVWFGANNLVRTTAVASGIAGRVAYQGNIGRTIADNYRKFSKQDLTNGFARLATTIAGTEVALVGLGLHMPLAENPGSLTAAQLDSAPTMADPLSMTRKARKEVDQLQAGLSARRQVGSAAVAVTVYGGNRSLYNPLTFAVVAVDRTLAGGSARADINAGVDGLRLTLGADFQRMDDDRKNWANCNGTTTATATCPQPGVEKGNLSLDQRELVTGGGPYARLELERGKLRASAGVRSDAIRFQLTDRFLTDSRDDSGVRTLRAVSPMAGVAWRYSRFGSVYANLTTAFETPTTTELGNHADGTAGLNEDLLPQFSTTVESGAKGIFGSALYGVSLFSTRVRDELIAFTSAGGRTYYQNAGVTRRDGVEVSTETTLASFDLTMAYSFSRFRFIDFLSAGTQMKGNQIPGIPVHQAQVAAARKFDNGGFIVAEGLIKSRVWANDANTAFAKSHEVVNLRFGWDAYASAMTISPTMSINNLFDRQYVGSLAINAAGTPVTAKFYEPAAGRTWMVGARVVF